MKRNEIERLLPSGFQRAIRPDSPLAGLLEAMEAMHAPSESALADLAAYFSARACPDAFVSFLANWVDLDWIPGETAAVPSGEFYARTPSSGIDCLREIVASSAHVSKWRGTVRGLIEFLEKATGERGFEVDETPRGPHGPLPFHVRIHAPASSLRHRHLVETIVGRELPVHLTYELVFEQEEESE